MWDVPVDVVVECPLIELEAGPFDLFVVLGVVFDGEGSGHVCCIDINQ